MFEFAQLVEILRCAWPVVVGECTEELFDVLRLFGHLVAQSHLGV